MRTRTRSTPQRNYTVYRWPRSTDTNPQKTVFLCVRKEYDETITDDPVKGAYEKSCSHIWSRYLATVPPEEIFDIPFEWKSNRPFRPAFGHSSWTGGWSANDRGPEFSNYSADSLATDALRQMWPSVNEGLSVINFILELKDLRRMFTLWSKRGTFLRGRNTTTGNLFKESARTISGMHLNWNFGWKPFISDVTEMVSSLSGLDRKIRWLKDNQNKVLKRNYRKKLDVSLPFGTGLSQSTKYYSYIDNLVPNHTDYSCVQQLNSRWVYAPRYHATLIYRYKIPDSLDDVRLRARALRDAFGVKLDPSIIWNAIPFSFVVDWFVKVGDLLQSFAPNDLDMQVEVLDFSHSLKYHMMAECSAYCTKPGGWKTPTHRCYVFERSYYERKRVIPNLHALVVANPGIRQGLLGGSLVLANSGPGSRGRGNRKVRPSRVG